LAATIDNLTDVQAVAAVRQLSRRIFAAVPFDTVTASTSAGALKDITASAAATKIDPAQSVAVSRQLLRVFAQDPGLVPLVDEIVTDVQQDDSLFIETTLTLGLFVNLTMFMATAELAFKSGKLAIKKGSPAPAVQKTLVDGIASLARRTTSLP
jgi:hypothetical protein